MAHQLSFEINKEKGLLEAFSTRTA